MAESQKNMLSERNQTKKEDKSMIPFIWKSRKCQLNLTTEANLCLPGMGVGSGVKCDGLQNLGHDGNVYYLHCGDGSMDVCICQNSSNCTL